MDRGLGHLSRFGFEALRQVGCVARVFNYVSKATNATRTRCTMLEQYIFAIGTQSKLRTVGFAWDSLLPKDTYTYIYICNLRNTAAFLGLYRKKEKIIVPILSCGNVAAAQKWRSRPMSAGECQP